MSIPPSSASIPVLTQVISAPDGEKSGLPHAPDKTAEARAEEDLKMRGTGAIFGTNQSGESGLALADFIQDYHLFIEASKWAARIFLSTEPTHVAIREEILQRLDENIHLICLN